MSKFCRGKYLKDTGKFYILNKSHNQTFLLHDIFLYLILCTNFFPWHFSLHEFFFDFFPTSPVTFLMALSLVVLRNFFSYFLSCLFRLFRLFLFCQLFFATFSGPLFLFWQLFFGTSLPFSRCSSLLLCYFLGLSLSLFLVVLQYFFAYFSRAFSCSLALFLFFSRVSMVWCSATITYSNTRALVTSLTHVRGK